MITIADFREWEKHPITKRAKEAFSELYKDSIMQSTTETILMDPLAAQKAARLLGQREGLELFLHMTFEDLQNDEESHSNPDTRV